MNIAYLLTGGNVGEREKNLAEARRMIEKHCGKITNVSSIYETEAWGTIAQPKFLNQALKVATSLNPSELLNEILDIEKKMGRVRGQKYGPRKIDIDILLFNQLVLNKPGLTIPHPELQNRRFALQCLNDIAAMEVHPVLNITIHQLLIECVDPLKVHMFQPV
jgi:2-amino-4-hydroxy-6-hydroxymethyldihydropteridine diphosphokinase